MKAKLIFITLCLVQLSLIKTGTLSFLASSICAGATYLYIPQEEQITQWIMQFKQSSIQNLQQAADKIDQSADAAGNLAQEAAQKAYKQQGKNFLSAWWNARKVKKSAEEMTHEAAKELAQQAEDIQNVSSDEIRQTVHKYYNPGRIASSVLVFLIVNKILS